MTKEQLYAEALRYHTEGHPGKIEIRPTKPHATQYDLSLAYSPGVAAPSLAIASDPALSYEYTGRGNLVAVISNGTAVLGLGNIGPLAAKPVMEGKCLLFKAMAGIDAFDIEVDASTPDQFVECVRRIAPTFGGINLEDIKAPECFEIERRLVEALDIPVMHDDQHGTAIIISAAMINAAYCTGKDLKSLRVVVSGAGAAAIAAVHMFLELGLKRENIVLNDSHGIVSTERKDLTAEKREFATTRHIASMAEALVDADVFLGVSKPGVLTAEMIRTMAPHPIILALANPDPEITRDEALAARNDVIYASGRSDTPNQVNNLLCFPYMFRGALDVRARRITEQMKIAAAHALAQLAREEVPQQVRELLGREDLAFGPDYIIPSPFDPRLREIIPAAVAKAAIESGVAPRPE